MVCVFVLGVGFFYEVFKWCDYCSNGCNVSGMSIVFEGVQGMGQIVGVGN